MSNHHVDEHWLYETGQRVNSRPGPVARQRPWITLKLLHNKFSDTSPKHAWETWPIARPVIRPGWAIRNGGLGSRYPIVLRLSAVGPPGYDPAAPGAIRASMRRTA